MKILAFLLVVGMAFITFNFYFKSNTGAPPYGESESEVPQGELGWLQGWQRPDGPPRIGLQVGHWNSSQAPEELSRLRQNTGSSGGGKSEWEVNLNIAELTASLLKTKGIEVDILPVTIPPRYFADAFVAIHADGSLDKSIRGYKFASPWRDITGKSNKLLEYMDKHYAISTGLPKDPNITRNMRGYYAFSWWHYDHAIHPMTTAVIAETGFLTSALDRKIIISSPHVSAAALAAGLVQYLQSENLL